jgi:hypothetical protein
MTGGMPEERTWLRLSCARCGAHTVVGRDQATAAVCPVCSASGLDLVGEELEPPASMVSGAEAQAPVAGGVRRFARTLQRHQRA